MVITLNHLKVAFLVAGFVLVVSNPVAAQSEKRELNLNFGPFKKSWGTIYEPSKKVYDEEAVRQEQAKMCLPNCKATKERVTRWEFGPYSQEQKHGKIRSHDEFVQ